MEKIVWTKNEQIERSTQMDRAKYLSLKETKPHQKMINDFNKKSLVNDKLNERYLTNQVSQNPFFVNNNYINDLNIRNEFLIPKNSNYN
jgi:hypothetical protein